MSLFDAKYTHLEDGNLMGKNLFKINKGVYGNIYTLTKNIHGESTSHLMVKQSRFEGQLGEDINHEYRIAHLLETNVPSFVAAPFGLVRGVRGETYREYLSLIQQPIRGITLNDLEYDRLTPIEIFYLFLQVNEMILRLGSTLVMKDLHDGNIMIDIPKLHIKFIDFGEWDLVPQDEHISYIHLFQNFDQ